jgi:LysM repeat protein
MASAEDDIIGARVVREPGAGSELSRIIRLGTPTPAPEPRPVSSAGGGRGRGPEPSWEQPRRNEAYPTIRTRARLPRIPRVAFGAIALAVAAALLFFVVPPLFVGNDAGGPGATSSSSPRASTSPRPSRTPARSAAPSPRVYVVRSGDTLSTIADRFNLTVDEILEANPDITNPNEIAVGDRIVIPTAATPTPDAEESTDEEATEEPAGT